MLAHSLARVFGTSWIHRTAYAVHRGYMVLIKPDKNGIVTRIIAGLNIVFKLIKAAGRYQQQARYKYR